MTTTTTTTTTRNKHMHKPASLCALCQSPGIDVVIQGCGCRVHSVRTNTRAPSTITRSEQLPFFRPSMTGVTLHSYCLLLCCFVDNLPQTTLSHPTAICHLPSLDVMPCPTITAITNHQSPLSLLYYQPEMPSFEVALWLLPDE
jgi:hypothetical protein